MNKSKKYLFLSLATSIVMIFIWINRIDSPFQRIIGILIISATCYWVGRLHEINLKEIRADGGSPLQDSPLN